MRAFVVTVVGAVMAAAVTYAQNPDPQKVAAGKTAYDTFRCSTCHMIDGKGNKRFPLDGVGAKVSADDIRKWLVSPAEMEAKLEKPPSLKMSTGMRNKKLTDADVDNLVAYMLSLK
ncbi:MAG: cytochrome c [Vicinamibacterales bacterium]